MKIAVCMAVSYGGASSGGVWESVCGLARSLPSCGVTASIVGLEEPSRRGALDLLVGCPVTEVRLARVLGPGAAGWAPAYGSHLDTLSADVIHVHGLWMWPSIAARNWSRATGRPRVISPHGMLDPWALRSAAWKKRIAALAFEGKNLKTATCIHALCESEASAVRRCGIRKPILVIPNGCEPAGDAKGTLPPWSGRVPGHLKILLYLGRLHPKKNLLALIQAWSQVQREARGARSEWCLVLVGWGPPAYAKRLHACAVAASEGGCRIYVHGPAFGPEKAAALAGASALILPSVSEGLPMVVLEAWSYGLPVVMTDACNLPEGFRAGAALRAGARGTEIVKGIADLLDMSTQDRSDMGQRGKGLWQEQFAWPVVARKWSAAYEWMVLGGSHPPGIEVPRGF